MNYQAMYSSEEIARQHAAKAWWNRQLWQCGCPSCQKVRDSKQEKIMIREDMGYGGPWLIEPAVEPIDDHTW